MVREPYPYRYNVPLAPQRQDGPASVSFARSSAAVDPANSFATRRTDSVINNMIVYTLETGNQTLIIRASTLCLTLV